MSIEEQDDILILLTRYLQGDVNDQEQKSIRDWISASDENKKYFEELEQVWEQSEAIADFENIEVGQEWQSFKDSVSDSNSLSTDSKKSWNTPFLKIAASVVLLLGISLFFLNSFNSQVTLVAQNEGTTKYVLPDKSTVWLNQGSELTFQKEFKGDIRETILKGEGYFEIQKNPNKPFVVLTNGTKTEVLGTTFNLKTDPINNETALVLVEGKVAFSSAEDRKIVLPGEKIIATDNGGLVKSRNQDANFDAWKSGVLKFENTKLSKVALEIERFYNIKLVFENPKIATCTLTNTFDNNSIEQVLEILTILYDITYDKVADDRILIQGDNCFN